MSKTACPLDCFDSCVIEYVDGAIMPCTDDEYTKNFLCTFLNHYEEYEKIAEPRFNGNTISMDEALKTLKEILKKSQNDQILYFKGNANMGVMQNVSGHFFALHGAIKADGSICSGAGDAGIEAGRGANFPLTLSDIIESEVVVLWGRAPHISNSHILPLLKDKKLIVIDPIKTQIAKNSSLHIQIKPHGDLFLALLIARFAIIEGLEDREFIKKHCDGFEDFYELTQSVRIKKTLDDIGVSLGEIGDFLELIRDKKTILLVGTSVQRYQNGSDVLRAIDSLGATLGLFAKVGCGVGFLSDATYGVKMPFEKFKKSTPKATIDFSKYNCLFIQGSNPLSQLPNSKKIEKEIKQCENIIYFGTYENESSKVAHLIIPASTFLQKDDLRFSYGSQRVTQLSKLKESDGGISEYELSAYLCHEFGYTLQSEDQYLEHFKNYLEKDGLVYKNKNIPTVGYRDGFFTDDEKFLFLDEFDHEINLSENELFLITNSSKKSLNSQFKREKVVVLHPNLGFADGEMVKVSSKVGYVVLEAKNSDSLRKDCILIYKGTEGVNNLTPSILSFEGKSASFQDIRVKVEALS